MGAAIFGAWESSLAPWLRGLYISALPPSVPCSWVAVTRFLLVEDVEPWVR